MPKPFDFAPGLRPPPIPTRDIEKRLSTFLANLRHDDAAHGEQFGLHDRLSRDDWDRISRRARKLPEAMRTSDRNPNIRKDDWGRLNAVFEGITLSGPATEHHADEIAADLLAEMPWMRQVTEIIWCDIRGSAARSDGLRFRPILLDGPPSVGKTHLARSLARRGNVPEVSIDVGAASDGFRLAGSTRNWGGSTPGRVVETILAHWVANPVVFLDEIDKAGESHIHELVRAGVGVGVLDCFVGDRDRDLRRVLADPVWTQIVWAEVHVSMSKAPRIRSVMDFLQEVFAAEVELLSGQCPRRPT